MSDVCSVITHSNIFIKTYNKVTVWPLIAKYFSFVMEHAFSGFLIYRCFGPEADFSSASDNTFVFPCNFQILFYL